MLDAISSHKICPPIFFLDSENPWKLFLTPHFILPLLSEHFMPQIFSLQFCLLKNSEFLFQRNTLFCIFLFLFFLRNHLYLIKTCNAMTREYLMVLKAYHAKFSPLILKIVALSKKKLTLVNKSKLPKNLRIPALLHAINFILPFFMWCNLPLVLNPF